MRRSIGTIPGFTLVEMLIAVGAFALIALGLTSIFDSTARTVTTGRRVGVMTEYAALLESQFRADFQAMTRDGFLVIRNEYANDALPVPLHGDDRSPRARRVDELMFFVKKPVSSARETIATGFNATSGEASVYYGHGQGRQLDMRSNRLYRRPSVIDTNFEPSSRLGVDVPGNPNRYASSWNLLRHVTVLAQPGASRSRDFGSGPGRTPFPPGITNPRLLRDGDHQIELQPAASSLFRRIAGFPPPLRAGLWSGGVLASGIVDVATTDLAEIREIVTTVSKFPNQIGDEQELWSAMNGKTRGGPGAVQFAVQHMHAWMDDALPANSMPGDPRDRTRMRAERSPPDFFAAVGETNPLAGAMRRADQMALASSVFIPSCTEFIVEWTFGMVDPNGQMIWHGRDRWVDLDGDGQLTGEEKVAWPYRGGMEIPLMLRGPRTGVSPDPNPRPNSPENPPGLDSWPVIPELIHGPPSAVEDPLTSYFGYFDPTFSPDLRNNAGTRNPDGDIEDIDDALSPTLPWAWPSLIRITLTLTDPIDPTFEQTFQFVFETPGNPVY